MNKGTIRRIIIIVVGTIGLVSLHFFLSDKTTYASVGDFYKGDDRYRGFYWFEQRNIGQDKLLKLQYPTPHEAKAAIESRRAALDAARNQMVELGFRDDTPPELLRAAIVRYKTLEAEMHEGAIRLVHAAEMANFTNPEIANSLEFPTNVFANKVQRSLDEQDRIATIKEFASRFDLILFIAKAR